MCGYDECRKVVSIDRVKPVFLPDNENPSISEPVPDFNQNLKNRHGRFIKMLEYIGNFGFYTKETTEYYMASSAVSHK